MPIVASLARATLLEAVRNRLLLLAVMVVVIAFGLAQFLNQVAITESREIQTALLAAPLRIASPASTCLPSLMKTAVASTVFRNFWRENAPKAGTCICSLCGTDI